MEYSFPPSARTYEMSTVRSNNSITHQNPELVLKVIGKELDQ